MRATRKQLIEVLQTPRKVELFQAKVGPKDENGCMNWTAYTDKKGYGTFTGLKKPHFATHVAHLLATGVWINTAKGACMCHTCDNPGCVNPEHLWIGTQEDNRLDMIRKGRQYGATVNQWQAALVRIAYRLKILTVIQMSNASGLSLPSVYRIINRETWKHVA